MSLTAEQVALYIVLPAIAFIAAIVGVWCCYKRRCCSYYRSDDALLPDNDVKHRVTIDLSKRSNSVLSDDTEDSAPQMGLKRKRSTKAENSHQTKHDYMFLERDSERRRSSGIQIPSLLIPSPKPDVRQTVPVGQALNKHHLSPNNSSLSSSSLKRRSLGLILEHSTYQVEDSPTEDNLLKSAENLSRSSSSVSKRVELIHSLSEPATSPRPLEGYQDEMNAMAALYTQRRASRDANRISQLREEDSPDRNVQPDDDHSSGNASPVLPTNHGRRRSSMQLPIDFRQINPNLYTNQTVTRMASVESDDTTDGQPLIHFALSYDQDLEVLTVKLIQARCLQTLDPSVTSDPYCSVSILPDANVRKSKVHRQTSSPEFEEKFTFSVSNSQMKNKILEIRSYEYDQFSRDECTGVMKLNLEELDFDLIPKYDLWKKFRPVLQTRPSQDAEAFGDLMLALSYLPSAEKLTVVIQKVRGLRYSTKRNSHECYVKVYLCKDGQRLKKKSTNCVRASSNPVFNQAITFTVPQALLRSKDIFLAFAVVEEGKLQSKDILGSLEIGSKGDADNDRQHWNEITKKHINKPVARWHKLKMPRRFSSPETNPLEFFSSHLRRDSAISK